MTKWRGAQTQIHKRMMAGESIPVYRPKETQMVATDYRVILDSGEVLTLRGGDQEINVDLLLNDAYFSMTLDEARELMQCLSLLIEQQ